MYASVCVYAATVGTQGEAAHNVCECVCVSCVSVCVCECMRVCVSKVGVNNIAIVIGPNLLWPDESVEKLV